MRKYILFGIILAQCHIGNTIHADIWSDIEKGITNAGQEINKGLKTFVTGLEDIGKEIAGGWDDVEKYMNGIGKVASGIPTTINNLDGLINKIKSTVNTIKYTIKPKYNAAQYPDEQIVLVATMISETFDDLGQIKKAIEDFGTYFVKPFDVASYNEIKNVAILFGEIKDLLQSAVNIIPQVATMVKEIRVLT